MRENFSVKRDILTQQIIEESDEITKKKTRLSSFCTDLQTHVKDEADQQLFVAIKKFDTALHKLEQELQTEQFTKLHSILQVRQSSDISSTLATLQIIEHHMDDIPELTTLNQCQALLIGSGNLKLTKSIDLKKLVESESPEVWKVCCFPSIKKVALSDTGCNCIYIYDCESGILDTMRFGDFCSPFYITTLDNIHALVAFIDGPLLKVNILDLSIKEDIKITSRSQYPICCVGDYLLVCDYGDNLHTIIVSKQGRIVRKIPVHVEVGYMCPYGNDKFIYTSYYSSSIECMTLDGKSIFKVTSLDFSNHFKDECCYEPMGVCVDKYNFIYVVFNNEVIRLTPEGKIDKIVLNLESEGYGIAYDSATHELVLIHQFDTFEFYKIE